MIKLLSPDIPSDAEVVVTAADTTICSPQLALDVIEQSLTPQKRNAYAKNAHTRTDGQRMQFTSHGVY